MSLLKVSEIPIMKASSVNLTKGAVSPSEKKSNFTIISHNGVAEGCGSGILNWKEL
jgi:hypothetical protein